MKPPETNFLDGLCDGTDLLCIVGACPLCSANAEDEHAQVSGQPPRAASVDEIITGAAELTLIVTQLQASAQSWPECAGSSPADQTTSRPALDEHPLNPSSSAEAHAMSWVTLQASAHAATWVDDSAPIASNPADPIPEPGIEIPNINTPRASSLVGGALAERLVELLSIPGVARDYLTALSAERMTANLHAFFLGAWDEIEPGTTLEDGEHIKAICDHVQFQCEERAIALGLMPKPAGWEKMRAQNLLIRIPPRSLKTVIVTIAATAWCWLRWPTWRILSLSSNPRVTNEGADKTRGLIRSAWYQNTFKPLWQIRTDMDGLQKFGNTAGGWRAARGITSRITGEGADWLIVDDPHDGAEVYSKAKRDEVNNKWRRSVANRVNDPRYAIRTGVMQALHFDDWGQHRITDGWGTLIIRMEFEARDSVRMSPYGWRDWRTVVGEPIHPRFTKEWRDNERKNKGAIDWAAQYQQDPAPIDGGIVKESDLRYYDELPKMEAMCITVDAAFKKTTTGSRVSVLVVGRKGPDRFVVDNDTRPMDMVETIASIKAMREKWPQAKARILVEDKANGSEIIRQLKEVFNGIIAINPGSNSKTGRLMAVQSLFAGNNVFFPKYAAWLDDMRFEICTFPNAPKDDQVDALVQALLDMRTSVDAHYARGGFSM